LALKAEEQLHRSVVQLLALYEQRDWLAYAHCPNGGLRSAAEAGRFRAMGVRAGVPDLLVWIRGGRSIGIELKAGRGKLSPEQIYWHVRVAGLGHRVYVCRSIDEVEAVLRAEGVPGIGQIAEIRSVSAAKPLSGVSGHPEDETHQGPITALLRGIP
jgi:hypothetical protein